VFCRIASFVGDLINVIGKAVRLPWSGTLFLSGAVWGFLPCAMVYAALFYAMLSASWLGGAVVMLGFGVGTLPPLVGASLGVPLLQRRAVSVRLRTTLGVALMMIGVMSVVMPPATIAEWCRFG
jgi:sulfite exporter TauE/SafE